MPVETKPSIEPNWEETWDQNWELIILDWVVLGGDLASVIPGVGVIGWGASTVASVASYTLTYNDYQEGRATDEDIQIARTNVEVGLIPWVGIVPAVNQLIYDTKFTKSPWKSGIWDWDRVWEWLEVPEEWYK